ncbi:hypothetical protein GDO78_021276, partial [Eleutherodactylus coqui]
MCIILCLPAGAALEISVPSTHKTTVGSPALIPCNYTVQKPPVNPKLFTAFWYLEGKQILSYDDDVRTTDPRYSLDIEKALNGRVDLSISNIALSDAGFYACSVLYSRVRKTKDITVYVTAPPQVTITRKTVVLNEESVLRCSITGFYPVDIGIKWFRGREMLRDVTEDKPRRNSDGSYSVDSTATITPTEEDREQNFSCRVQHESLKKPLQEDFQLLYRVYRDENVMPDYQSLPIAGVIGIIIAAVGILVIILAVALYWNKLASFQRPASAGRSTLSGVPGLSVGTAGEQIMPLMQNLASAATSTSQVIPPREVPVKFTISQSNAVMCFMRLLKFYPADIKIIWTNEDKLIPSTKKLIQTDGEQTFDATSKCTVPWKYFISGVRVTWEHQSLSSPQHRDFRLE